MNFVKPSVRISLYDAACLCDVIPVYVLFLIYVMFGRFDCIVLCLYCTYMFFNNMKCMQGPNENQFQLFGLALGKYTQYTNSVPDIDLGVCKVNLNGPVARRCGQLLCRSSEDLVHLY